MKVLISFICGISFCGLLLFGVRTVLPIKAETDGSSGSSGNVSESLINLIPDIEKIYREALIMPFKKAESKIYDEDIADFYRELLDRSVLSESGDTTE